MQPGCICAWSLSFKQDGHEPPCYRGRFWLPGQDHRVCEPAGSLSASLKRGELHEEFEQWSLLHRHYYLHQMKSPTEDGLPC